MAGTVSLRQKVTARSYEVLPGLHNPRAAFRGGDRAASSSFGPVSTHSGMREAGFASCSQRMLGHSRTWLTARILRAACNRHSLSIALLSQPQHVPRDMNRESIPPARTSASCASFTRLSTSVCSCFNRRAMDIAARVPFSPGQCI